MQASEPFLTPPRFLGLLGDEARRVRTWRIAFLAVLALLGLAVLSLMRVASQSRVQPVVVLVDELGRAELLGPAARMAGAERERVVRAELGLLVRNLRSVYPDAHAQAEMLRRAYAYLSPEGARAMNAHFSRPENDPRLLARELTREVRVRSVGPIPGTESWRVQWTEAETPHGAAAARESAWEAYVALRESEPRTTEEAAANPLGLRVTAINWTPITQEAP